MGIWDQKATKIWPKPAQGSFMALAGPCRAWRRYPPWRSCLVVPSSQAHPGGDEGCCGVRAGPCGVAEDHEVREGALGVDAGDHGVHEVHHAAAAEAVCRLPLAQSAAPEADGLRLVRQEWAPCRLRDEIVVLG